MLGDLQIMMNTQTKTQQDPQLELTMVCNEDVQFGYHSASGEQIRITSNGLGARRMKPDSVPYDGVVYGAFPLRGRAEFEVKITIYKSLGWNSSLGLGVMRCKKDVKVASGPDIPGDSYSAKNHCMWANHQLCNKLVSDTISEEIEYGCIDLDDLREGDHVGLCLSEDGVLEFTVNGESQGIAAENIYIRDTDVYAVVDHYGQCVATVITKAGI